MVSMRTPVANTHVHMTRIERLVAVAVVTNVALLILGHLDYIREDAAETLEWSIMAVFVVDVIVRWKEESREGFHNKWLLFDTALTICGLIPVTNAVAGLRLLRLVRVLRLVHLSRHMFVHGRAVVAVARAARAGTKVKALV